MIRLLLKLAIATIVIFAVAYFSQGGLLEVDGWQAALIGAVVLGLVNTFIRPILKLLTLPISIVTLGLFSLVINTLMLYLVSWIVPGIGTVGIIRTFVAALIISAVTTVFYWFVDKD
jgi:putative membrane protein